MNQDIEIHIGEIVLDRMPAGDIDLFRAAIEAGLSARISENGWPDRFSTAGHRDLLRGDRVIQTIQSQSYADQIAAQVYQGLCNDAQRL